MVWEFCFGGICLSFIVSVIINDAIDIARISSSMAMFCTLMTISCALILLSASS